MISRSSLATPVNFIVHSLMDVNDQLAHGRPFFVDIARGGVILYETPGNPLVPPGTLPQAKCASKQSGISITGFQVQTGS